MTPFRIQNPTTTVFHMKYLRKIAINSLSVAIVFVILTSCNSKEIVTEVHPDGSFSKHYTTKVNTSFLQTGKMDTSDDDLLSGEWLPEGDGWKYFLEDSLRHLHEVTIPLSNENLKQFPTIQNDLYTLYFSRCFTSGKEYTDGFALKKDTSPWAKVKSRITLNKRFLWFQTIYSYKEVYDSLPHPMQTPPSLFMSQEEIDFMFSGNPTLTAPMNGIELSDFLPSVTEKYTKWLAYNQWNYVLDKFLSTYQPQTSSDPSLEEIQRDREQIFESEIEDYANLDICTTLKAHYPLSSSLQSLKKDSIAQFEEELFKNNLFVRLNLFPYKHKLLMPGVVYKTNAPQMVGDTLLWNVSGARMSYCPFEMYAESRIIHYWAYLLTALLLLLIPTSLYLIYNKRRKK